MVEQGARSLVLLARNKPSESSQQTIDRLRQSGAQVVVSQCDVSDFSEIDRVVRHIRGSMPPLRGVMHCAGVFADKLLADHEWGLFDRVFDPKVIGAWNLHLITADEPLEFFVLFSAAASLFGGVGVGNYVAANAFVDALAHHRKLRGLPGVSINWGPWAGTGMAEAVDDTRRAQWAAWGLDVLNPETALAAMDYILEVHPDSQIGVFQADWTKVRALSEQTGQPAFLARVLRTETSPRPGRDHNFRQQLEAARPLDRRALLTSHVRSLVARVLGLNNGDSLNPRQGLFEAGMDSLASMELRNELQASLGCTLSSTLVFMYPNVESLVNHLAADILSLDHSAARDTNGHVAPVPVAPCHTVPNGLGLDSLIADELQALERLLN
jgi:myxalamid-type polyketide synthase MxaB